METRRGRQSAGSAGELDAMRRKKILLVDDSSSVLMLERLILSKGPFELLMAEDGLEAVEKAVQERPDLILMDLVMPKLNGLEATRRLRGNVATRSIPIILVTNRGEAESVEASYESGCSDTITKPINSLELFCKVGNYLSG
jgi:CheY-like chemotaxis protein